MRQSKQIRHREKIFNYLQRMGHQAHLQWSSSCSGRCCCRVRSSTHTTTSCELNQNAEREISEVNRLRYSAIEIAGLLGHPHYSIHVQISVEQCMNQISTFSSLKLGSRCGISAREFKNFADCQLFSTWRFFVFIRQLVWSVFRLFAFHCIVWLCGINCWILLGK